MSEKVYYAMKVHSTIKLLKKIPKGKVATYKEMARVCGTSPRAIGRIMASNKDPMGCPCYKVVAVDGKLCGYSGMGGLQRKQKLLEKEGIVLEQGKVPKRYFYTFPV
ncbi:MAG: hypothetical protein A3C04_03565 [Candidatus Wildermuthbacteria bacterium RIFCSPHIGHO2_02_FULL_45_25]|uniref:Methylated-DNA-[protein]-cysteine S-methyltransferase DNA binding domain-containing protein n=1 Tax=Candidatus Wildermuthbacteria bacterium RIFCSPHIGHO2_02_FULL_45_25 TaxID=1802450 RepID=A0A1G2R096_9BACT|nr:MAG: hypothetical protein A3C04_03565 [Candidatus Wildermuthbacteria bacterium RIFCSPHIGHO2_02_FULL_45_25]